MIIIFQNDGSPPAPFCRDPLANLDLQVNRETQAYRYTSIFTPVLPNEAKYGLNKTHTFAYE